MTRHTSLLDGVHGGAGSSQPGFGIYGNTLEPSIAGPHDPVEPEHVSGGKSGTKSSRYLDRCRTCKKVVELTTDGDGNLVALNPHTWRQHGCQDF